MRTQDEIVERIKGVQFDFMGTITGDLVEALDFEHARQFLKPDVTEADWHEPADDEKVRAVAIDYLTFAFGKAEDHRGLSANRSVEHFETWLWLLGRLPDDWDDIEYAQYGVPKLVAAALALGVEPALTPTLRSMSEGLPCRPNCGDGCGS